MFDEVNNQAVPTPPVDQPTTNPVVEPSPASAPSNAVQDIFANVESPVASVPVPDQSFGLGQSPLPTGDVPSNQPVSPTGSKPDSKAKLVLISLAILIVAAGGALAYLSYFKPTAPEVIIPEEIRTTGDSLVIPTEVTPTPTEEIVTEPTGTEPIDLVGIGVEPTASATTTEVGSPAVVEQPAPEVTVNLDSDQDGLTDAEELNIYQTNPLQADSDGDGYLDGDEVKAGYNPSGEGLLAQ
jgi:hypothetical protein